MTSIIPNKNKKEKQRKTKRWPIVLRWARIWTVVTALAMPPLFAVGTWIGKRVGVELGWGIWALYLGSMVLSIIVPAKKYEFHARL